MQDPSPKTTLFTRSVVPHEPPARASGTLKRSTPTISARVLLAYTGLYIAGMLIGLAAQIAFDVQVRRPGSRQLIGLVILVLLLWGAISITHTPFTDILLPLLWAGTGLLAGFGSRELTQALV